MKGTAHTIELGGLSVEYLLKPSRSAQRIRVRVGLRGVEVVRPRSRSSAEVEVFLEQNQKWLIEQIARAAEFRRVRPVREEHAGQILFRGHPTDVRVIDSQTRSRANLVRLEGGRLLVLKAARSTLSPAESLENWLRKRARELIEEQLAAVTARLKVKPGTVYIMGQRTKWGNCSAMRNLSFNWRIVMAPDHVLRYLVTHEAVHLAVPDHSQRFWLVVQGLCKDAERARAWLSANAASIMVDLRDVIRAGARQPS